MRGAPGGGIMPRMQGTLVTVPVVLAPLAPWTRVPSLPGRPASDRSSFSRRASMNGSKGARSLTPTARKRGTLRPQASTRQ